MVEQFKQCGYKTESVELTPESLVAANYGTVWTDAEIKAEDGYNERRPRRASFAPIQAAGGTTLAKFAGKFEPRPYGTDGTAPDWYAMLAASGATISTDTATFGAESTSTPVLGSTVTIKTRDGAYEKISAGSRISKLRFFAEKGATWACEVEATGRYSQSAQTAFIAAAHPSAGLGQPFLGMGATIDSVAYSFSSAEIAIENTVTPAPDGTHATGYGRNIITGQKLMYRASILEDGSVDWRGKFRNDAAGDLLAVSLQMSAGSAGNVLTWTGSICLTEQPSIEYLDGLGYVSLAGEFVTSSASAALTLVQS